MSTDYPGLNWMMDAMHPAHACYVTFEQQHRIRSKLADPRWKLGTHRHFDRFVEEAVAAAFNYRCMQAAADGDRYVVRRVRLRDHLMFLEGRIPHSVDLSQQDKQDLSRIRHSTGKSEIEAAQELKDELADARTRRGRRPLDEIESLVDSLADAYRRLVERKPTGSPDGPFVAIVGAVLHVASLGRKRSAKHQIDRYLAHAIIVEEGTAVQSDGTVMPAFRQTQLSRSHPKFGK